MATLDNHVLTMKKMTDTETQNPIFDKSGPEIILRESKRRFQNNTIFTQDSFGELGKQFCPQV